MWRYNHIPSVTELYHYGVKGMKWGVRKVYAKTSVGAKIGLQFFAQKAGSRKTVQLPIKEYAHVMSELHTHISQEERKSHPVIYKYIGKYMYGFQNNFDDTYRVIEKRKIRSR